MKKCLFALSALIFLSAIPISSQQSSDENPSVDCTDPTAQLSDNCAQTEQQETLTPNRDTNFPANAQRPSTGINQNAQPGEMSPLNLPNSSLNGQKPREKPLPPESPTEFQKFVAATTGQLLPIYGASLFRNVPSTFSPSDLAPVTPDYVVGPDDELRVRIWGQISYSGNLRVDRSGDIYLPQVGAVHVAGFSYSALDQHLRAAVSRIYRNFDLSVDVGRIRSIQVYVAGQARRPGVYTVSSLSSLVDALFASGGPSLQGSLRHIQVNRDGKMIADFDLYGLLVRGDKSKDVHLLPEDVIFIPPVGPQVAITGSIRNPGIYELRDSQTIGELIDQAGNADNLASNDRISLDRVERHQRRTSMEFAFDASGLAASLADGDIVHVYAILPSYQKTVTLRGNVANPGRFGWHDGMHLSDLIPDRDSLVSRDYWWKRSHLGLPVPEFEPVITTIGRDDQTPEINRQGFTSSVSQELLTSALNQRDDQSQIPDSEKSRNSSSRQMAGSGSLASQDEQRTTLPATQNARNSVNSSGYPSFPANTEPPRNEIFLAAPEINWNYAVIERIDPDTLKTSLVAFDLGQLVINHDASQNLALQPGDTVTVFSQADIKVPLEQRTKYVRLEGEFGHAGIYSVLPGETLRDIVRRAGGVTSKAYLYGSEFTRESTRILQQQRIDEYVRSVTVEAERGTQALAVSGTASGSSAADVTASKAVSQDLISRLSQVRATGRIVLEFRPDDSTLEDIPALTLENGDRFAVPAVPATINVVGAVYDQNSFVFRSRRTVGQYLRLAGGPNRNADFRHSFVIRADGSVISSSTARRGWSAWSGNTFSEMHVNPGDTIVVPDKTLRPTALRNLIDWTQVFSQLAFGAAAINVLH